MNIAFEISTLITASGSFGDKSGVYRYTYGLITSLYSLLQKKDNQSTIVLFSFNHSLLRYPLNTEILKFCNQKNIIFIKKIPRVKRDDITMSELLYLSFFKHTAKIINTFIPIKLMYENYIYTVQHKMYVRFLTQQLKKYHVTHIFHSQTGFYPMKTFKNITTIYDLTPFLLKYFHREETLDLQKRKIIFTLRDCDGIIAISKSTKKDMISYSKNFLRKKIVIGYPGLDHIFNSSQSTKNTPNFDMLKNVFNKNCNGIERKKYILYYGTFEPRKNLPYLVQAFYELQNNQEIPIDFRLIFTGGAGWGNVKKNIANYLQENYPENQNKTISVLDYINDKYLLLFIQNAYAVVYPSLYEGFGLPVLESMSLGIPVICSDTSSLPEVGGNAVSYIDPYDFFDLKNKIKHLVNHPEYAHTLSQKGIIQSKKFTWEKTAKKIYTFMHDL